MWGFRVSGRLLAVAALCVVLAGTGAVAGRVPSARAATCSDPDPIARHYCELGGTGSFLGAPAGAARDVAGGRVQDYAGGSIYWSPSTGAHEVHGSIGLHYRGLGGPVGSATVVLGFPTTDETVTPDRIGRFNHFQGGSVYWSPATGAHEVHGAIREKWTALGWERGLLGYPLTDETPIGAGGRVSDFQGGSVYWSPSTGAHEVHGAIGVHYRELGGPGGNAAVVLGFPTTDETVPPDRIGRFNHFQGGSVYWSPSTGAHEVHGAIREKWTALGWERGLLGYPLTDETVTPDGIGRYNRFQGGSVYWSPSTGAHEVHGAIGQKWASLGSERSALGYPITDEYAVNSGRQSDFQGGFLRWTAATGAVDVAVLSPYTHAGTWVTRFRFSREYAGANPPITPADVDTMADRGVHTLYLQAAADDPLYPGLLSPDLLGQFLVRAHARGMQVVAWYLPHLTNVPADLSRLRAMVDFRSGGQAFDAIGVDIEDTTVVDVDTRNAALVDLSTRLRAAAPGVTLGAIVLPPVVTDVLNPAYWPRFPWHQLSGLYQVWLPMAYWSNRTDPFYSDPARYVTENITRLRGDLGEQCAAVAVVGGYGAAVPASAYAAMSQAAAQQGAVGVSIFDWTTTPADAWPPVTAYDVRGC